LAFGPGLLESVCVGEPVEFMLVARNDLGENRVSGRDKFEVKVQRKMPIPEDALEDPEFKQEIQEIDVEITDNGDGTYACKYLVEEECNVDIDIKFLDNSVHNLPKYLPLRGSPYQA